jgi:hypothetical protein
MRRNALVGHRLVVAEGEILVAVDRMLPDPDAGLLKATRT